MNAQDTLQRFLFERRGIRGEWIHLTESWQAILKNQKGLAAAQPILGEALAAVSMLSATIKFNGSLILQAHGQAAIKTMVAQCTHDRKIRGIITDNQRYQENVKMPTSSLPNLFGQGQLALTIRPDKGEAYQGIIALVGNNLAGALENYFTQSEQLKTRLWLFADQYRASGFLIQEIPGTHKQEDDWQHIEILANTLTREELMTLSAEEVLHRLFHEEEIRLFDAEPVKFECACSRMRVEQSLKALGLTELDKILHERGIIEVHCEFCNGCHLFDKIDIAHLMLTQDFSSPSTTHH